jgi:L-seryl-tRNA(Ser) seleniumtransferase
MGSNPLRNVPGLGPIFESTTVRRLSDRMHRGSVVNAAKAVWEELRHEAESVKTEGGTPDISDLADRIATRLRTPTGGRPDAPCAINATGRLLDPRFGSPALPTVALDAILETAARHEWRTMRPESVEAAEASKSEDADSEASKLAPTKTSEQRLAKLLGTESARLISHRGGAVALAIRSVARGKELIVARGDLLDLSVRTDDAIQYAGGPSDEDFEPDGYSVPAAIEASGAVLREAGSVNRTTAADYAAEFSPETGALFVLLRGGASDVEAEHELERLREIVSAARERKIPVVCDLGAASLVDMHALGVDSIPHATDYVQAGADLVVLSDRYLFGLEPTAVIAGRRALMDCVEQSPMTRWFSLDPLRRKAWDAVLPFCGDSHRAAHELPLLLLLTTTIENLRTRASRLRPLLESLPHVDRVEQVEGEAELGADVRRPTVRLLVKMREQTASATVMDLRGGSPSVAAFMEGDAVAIDLRSVFASQDRMLIDALARLEDAEETPTDEVEESDVTNDEA